MGKDNKDSKARGEKLNAAVRTHGLFGPEVGDEEVRRI
jgi:hypothetical protein